MPVNNVINIFKIAPEQGFIDNLIHGIKQRHLKTTPGLLRIILPTNRACRYFEQQWLTIKDASCHLPALYSISHLSNMTTAISEHLKANHNPDICHKKYLHKQQQLLVITNILQQLEPEISFNQAFKTAISLNQLMAILAQERICYNELQQLISSEQQLIQL
ncbi:MAG: hypothetical protein AAF153_01110, partial [Pseudomonadota bacterium]